MPKRKQLDITDHMIWKDKNIKPETKEIYIHVNDTIRMYKKGKIKMYKIVHDISPRVHSFVILWSEDWR